jgi:acyl-coenzyme A synthetase/AMP-(fatty) acid ligase
MVNKPKFLNSEMETARTITVGGMLRKKAFLTPERTAVVWKEKEWTFRELNTEVNRLSNSFREIGISRGERISILTKNRVECSHILYSSAKLGAISASLNWKYTNRELEDVMKVITPETIIVSEEYYSNLLSVLPNLPFVKRIILLDKSTEIDKTLEKEIYLFDDLIENGKEHEPNVEIHEEDALFIVFTSGTTGTPKGAIISHRAEMQRVFAQMGTFPTLLNVTEDDAYIATSPFFYVTSTDQMFATHALGGKVIIIEKYDPEAIVSLLEEETVTWLPFAPGMYEGFKEEILRKNAKIKGVKAIGSMADLVPHNTIAEITRLVNAPFFNTYGATEFGMHDLSQSLLPIGNEGNVYRNLAKREGHFGQIRLVNSNGEEVQNDEPGELILRTPLMFSGYWNNPKENEKSFRGGWFHTGDVFVRNADGSLDFVSRTKYMIKSGGENIYPIEIERVLLRHPYIKEAVVVRASHPKWGETPIAYVAVSQDVDPSELKEFCKQHGLAKYKLPNVIEFVDLEDFPRNTSGKIVRNEIEKWNDQIKIKGGGVEI